jgi:hypothetical protein
MDMTSISGRFKPYTIYWRFPLSHNGFPLQSRGWVYQEALLSPRLLHFGKSELVWECAETTACECGMVEPDIGMPFSDALSFHSGAFGGKATHYKALSPLTSPGKLKDRWRDTVGGYARDRSDVDCVRRVERDNHRRSEAGEVARPDVVVGGDDSAGDVC